MRGHVRDPLAVDVNLAPVAQAFEIFRAGERSVLRADRVLGLHAAHGRAPDSTRYRPPAKASAGPGVNVRDGGLSARLCRRRDRAGTPSAITTAILISIEIKISNGWKRSPVVTSTSRSA